MKIKIPGYPPSLNRFSGRENAWAYRTEKAKWTERVYLMCRASRELPAKPFEHAHVSIAYFFKTNVRRDADNYSGKLLLDGLTKAGVIVDDDMRHIKLSISGGYDPSNPRTEITITEEA